MSTEPASPVPASGGRPSKGERTQIAMRLPDAVLAGVDRQAAKDGISRNDALILAARSYGEGSDDRPALLDAEAAPRPKRASTTRRATSAVMGWRLASPRIPSVPK